jgi:DNA polymerase III subunit gamma/tau
MSSFYQKYRPDSFDDLVGNEAAINAFKKSLTKKNHSHVYLLSGPPGTGKTTIARIAATLLGAEDMDVREINTSSARGIETAREIIQQLRMMPSDGDSIVYILDECHKFTNDMQNALLKPLEDCPEHVYFFLCTTEPNKLIKAIKSRCTEIKTTPLSDDEISLVLKRVIKLEKLDIEKDIITEIAERSEGSSRNALVMLEQIANAETKKDIKIILDSKGSEDDPDTIELCRALLNDRSDWGTIAKILKKLKEAGKLDDSESVRYMVLGYANAVLLNGRMTPRAALMLEAFSENTYNTGKFGITLACINVIS